jgi:hypothetical protein
MTFLVKQPEILLFVVALCLGTSVPRKKKVAWLHEVWMLLYLFLTQVLCFNIIISMENQTS